MTNALYYFATSVGIEERKQCYNRIAIKFHQTEESVKANFARKIRTLARILKDSSVLSHEQEAAVVNVVNNFMLYEHL